MNFTQTPSIPDATDIPMADPTRLVHPDTPPRGDIQYDSIAFYGRTFGEYERFFNFDGDGWRGYRVLDCHGRASSFASEAVRRGIKAVA